MQLMRSGNKQDWWRTQPYDYVVCTNLHKVIIREMTFIMIDTDDRNYLFNLSKFMMDNLYLYFYAYTWLTFN